MKSNVKSSVAVLLVCGSLVIPSCEKSNSLSRQNDVSDEAAGKKYLYTNNYLSVNTITVTDCNLNNWQKQKAAGAAGTIIFTSGPEKYQTGRGSLQFVCPDQKFLRLNNNQYIGTRLEDITSLSYSTYVQQSGSLSDNVFVVIQVDVNNDGSVDFPLVFNPVFQTGSYISGIGPDQGITELNTWQTWDLKDGGWWRGDGPDPWNSGVIFTLATLLDQYPDATITNVGGGPGSVRISGGAPYFTGTFIGYVDTFRIGINGVTSIFDFEATTANAGPDRFVTYGYGSGCVTLSGTAAGGVAPYSYAWSPGGSSPGMASTEVCPTITTEYILTVTDANGCIQNDTVTVFVNDVRCGKAMDKVLLCHKGHEICVAQEAVPAHLAHGDFLGKCDHVTISR